MIKLSDYTTIFEKNDTIALWHSLKMNKIYGDSTLKNLIKYLKNNSDINLDKCKQLFPEPIINSLMKAGFIISDKAQESETVTTLIKNADNTHTKNMVMLISNHCNFNCVYCQIEQNIPHHKPALMSKETADKAIDLFLKQSKEQDNKTIVLTGGEPLLNPDILEYIIKTAQLKLKNTRIVIFTNGSILSEKLLNLFKDFNVLVLVSLDGPKEMHNQTRKTLKNADTFDLVVENYKKLCDYGINIGISAVGGEHNTHDINRLVNFLIELAPSSIGLNFSHYLIDKDNPVALSIADFGKILIEIYKALRKENIFLENISRVIKSFTDNQPRFHECQGEGSGFTVDARGKIGPCKSLLVSDIFSLDINNIDTSKPLKDIEIFKSWSQRTPFRNSKCLKCPALTLCGGGCAYDSYIANNGKYQNPDYRVCDYQLNILEFLIWELFSNIKSKLNHGGIYIPTTDEQNYVFNKYYNTENALQRSVGHETK